MFIEIIVILNDSDNETEWSNDLQESVERGGSSPRLDSAFVRGGGAASVIIITDHDDHHHDHDQNRYYHYFKTCLCDYHNCTHYYSKLYTSYSL